MIAIADSGTTKTSWVFVDPNKKLYHYKTVGFNPYYQSPDNIATNLKEGLIPNLDFSDATISKIFFYGAGCELQEKREHVGTGIRAAFPNAEILVSHDLLAAARALFGDSEGIACISGTGSNSCLYDGKSIVKNVHSLGLFLGDEGSGGYKGKLLIRDYIRNSMPAHIHELFEKQFTDRTADILDKVYTKEFPSRYLASFTTFLTANINEPYVQELVYKSFAELIDRCVSKYNSNAPIGFIGSIAFYFQDILKKVGQDKGLTISKIIKDPLQDLAEYHFSHQM